jgi:uncharacterized membrane protein
MLSVVVRTLAVVVTGILAGMFFGDWSGTSPVRPTLPGSCFIQFQQGLHSIFVQLMPVLIFTGIATNAVAALALRRKDRLAAASFTLAALAFVVIAVLTRAVNVPINELLMTWSAESPPADWWPSWQPWERTHTVRTSLAVAAFVVQVLGLNFSSWRGAAEANARS